MAFTTEEKRLIEAFFYGAKWWEWKKTGQPKELGGIGVHCTMCQSDQELARQEASKQLADGFLGLTGYERLLLAKEKAKKEGLSSNEQPNTK